MQRFPVGFWNYTFLDQHPVDASCVKDWDEAGMTVAMSPGYHLPNPEHAEKIRAILDECHRRRIKVILYQVGAMYWHLKESGEQRVREAVTLALREFGDHPAVLGLHCGDEPKKDDTDIAIRTVQIHKELAPHWQPFLNLFPWHQNIHPYVSDQHWPQYLDYLYEKARFDFYAYDCYYHMNPGEEGWEIYFKNLEHFSAAARRHNIEFWTTLLCTAHFNYRIPTEDDLRWQLHSALAWGAKGIVWFFFYLRYNGHGVFDNFRHAPINEFWQRTEMFDRLSYVNRQFLNTLAPVLNELRFKHAYNIGLNWGWGGYPFHGRDRRVLSATAPGPLIVSEFTHKDGTDYVAVTNNSCTQNIQATLAVRGCKPTLLQVGLQGKESPVSPSDRGDTFVAVSQWFAPGQMALYRVMDEKP